MKRFDWLTLLPAFALLCLLCPDPANAGTIRWYDYRVYCNKQISAAYNIKANGCDNKCIEGHECTNCSGWEVRRGSQLMQAGTTDKTPCCTFSSSCGTDPKFGCCSVLLLGLRCNTSNCPANNCPANYFSKTVNVAHSQFDQCAPGGASMSIPSQRLAVGTRENNSIFCGSHCNDSDSFVGYGFAYAFGYTVAWTCDGQDHIANDCTITANSACGNGVCELIGNEHQYNCPEDCEGCNTEVDPDCQE